jgi:hypothetical protein
MNDAITNQYIQLTSTADADKQKRGLCIVEAFKKIAWQPLGSTFTLR